MRTYELDDVYGMSRKLPENYVTRKSADEALKQNLQKKTTFGNLW